ncbi:hypothetical protein FHR83_008675 [Actinoplanes campanulatus]|uniref:Proteins of 100 residues with WXG n=1 Tax=Actinoplanes campanulatus TaxID=113559 RepID=A0A7W5ARB2_9ACTN|nr:hypothetical protein [Actinoplanes campanulatus]MBB3100948.1 hypothetical protein [Actinoplanes campanulatus]GGN48903.1 hypothetical protein GCM10010109_86390 [Actinoplanes campanulatus]GID41765.1 hypothetical protein Aca09nite_82710 [Actinoplanes campanulatus]
MSQVNASPESMRELSAAVLQFVTSVDEAKQQMQQASSAAADGWDDEVAHAVYGQIDEMLNSINVADTAQDISSKIDGKAAKLEEFLAG